MSINNSNTFSNAHSGWNERNGISLYNEFAARNFTAVKIGRKYYLYTGSNVIDIGNYNDFWRTLCDHTIFDSNDIVTGRELRELIRLVKRYAVDLKASFVQEGRDEDLKQLQMCRGRVPEQKQFVRTWIQRN